MHAQVNVYTHDLLEPLAAKLADLAPGAIDTFFFANSGAEITEAAVKLAKQVTQRPEHDRVQRLVPRTHPSGDGDDDVEDGLPRRPHTAPVGNLRRRRSPTRWSPTGGEVDRAFGGLDHLLATVSAPAETAAMILEPVLGEGGYIPAPKAFLQGIVGTLPRARHPLHRRRGAERLRPHRHDVRGRAVRRRAGRDLHGQGHRLGIPVRRLGHPPRARRPMANRRAMGERTAATRSDVPPLWPRSR